jgi:hypothetical protein
VQSALLFSIPLSPKLLLSALSSMLNPDSKSQQFFFKINQDGILIVSEEDHLVSRKTFWKSNLFDKFQFGSKKELMFVLNGPDFIKPFLLFSSSAFEIHISDEESIHIMIQDDWSQTDVFLRSYSNNLIEQEAQSIFGFF